MNAAGEITTVAGEGSKGFSGDGDPAPQAKLNTPTAAAVGPSGSLFIADSGNLRVRRVQAPPADLSVKKTVDRSSALVGDVLTYTIDAANAGPMPEAGVTMTDVLPLGLKFKSASQSCDPPSGGRTVVCSLGTLPAGAKGSVTIEVIATHPGLVNNIARVDGGPGDPDLSNNQEGAKTTVTGDAPPCEGSCADLAITKTANPEAAFLNEEVTYTLKVTNAGPDSAPEVTVLDQLPPEVKYIESSNGCRSSAGDTVVTCLLGQLAPGSLAIKKHHPRPRSLPPRHRRC